MAVSVAFRAPAVTSSYRDWDRLREAHERMRRVDVAGAMRLYRQVVKDGVDRYFIEGLWPLTADPDEPSLVWACIYLTEYCMKLRTWTGWHYLSERYVFSDPRFPTLSATERSRLISTRSRARIVSKGANLRQLEAEQRAALAMPELGDFERALHHIQLGEYHRQRRQLAAIEQLERAMELLPLDVEPYYAIRARENLAVTCDYLKDIDPRLSKRALALYEEINALAERLGDTAGSERQSYNMGWVFAETGQLNRAMNCFRRGYRDAVRDELTYDASLNEYGQAYIHLCWGEYAAALDLLLRARRAFWANASELTTATGAPVSPLMTAVCSNLLALTYAGMGDMDRAVQEARKALDYQRQLDNPVQLHNALSTLVELHWKRRDWLLAARYALENLVARRRARK